MKHIQTISVVVLGLFFGVAHAQTSGSASQSQAQAGAQSGSAAAAVINIGGGGGVDGQGAGGGTPAISGGGGGLGVGIGGGGGSASANNTGNHQYIQMNSEAADLGDAVGAAFAPALTTTLSDTCMGSTSGGIGLSGGALSFGKTWSDEECVRRLHARQLGSWGMSALALEMMCDSPFVLEADMRLAETGGKPHCSATYLAMEPGTDPVEGDAGIRVYPLDSNPVSYVEPVFVDEFELGAAAVSR